MVLATLPIEYEPMPIRSLLKRRHPNTMQTRWEHQWNHCLSLNAPRCLPLNPREQNQPEFEDEYNAFPPTYPIWAPDWEQDWIA